MISTLLVCVLAVTKHATGLLSNNPVSSIETVYTATIYENATSVKLGKDIRQLLPDGASCSVKVEWLFPNQEKTSVPFGYNEGMLVLHEGHSLDCEVKRIYDVILNSNCVENKQSISVRLRVFIADVNEHKPVFSQSTYVTRYVEGESLSFILKVVAHDSDCVNDHMACAYKIITPDVPFQVNSAGLIWPTTPLDPSVPKYEFKVVALDCTDGTPSEPATVFVYVEEACRPRFKVDITQQFDYAHPFHNILLLLCPFCKPMDIVVRISLEFDRPELLSCTDVHCDGGGERVENLLDWYDSMDNKEPPQECTYSFNGDDDFLVVEDGKHLHSLYENNLQVQFWMRLTVDLEPKLKRQIICESDTSELNRHHFSIYVQNGLLKLLRRHGPMLAPANHEFFPSEWSWNISQYIDKRWHKYNLVVKPASVELYVDFNREPVKLEKSANGWQSSELNLVDVAKTNLTIGACWHGRSEKYVQNFYGDLAGLKLTFPKIERSNCYRNCSQRLEIRSDGLTSGQSYALGKNKSTVVLRASSMNELKDLLDRVGYVHSENPIPLSVLLNGTIVCENMPKTVISELWLRASNEQGNPSDSLDNEGIYRHKPGERATIGKGLMKTTPGFVYSGWMLIIVVTLASGLAVLAVTMIMNNRYSAHHRCPTDESVEFETYNITLNPLRSSNIPLQERRQAQQNRG